MAATTLSPTTCLERYEAFERRVLPALFERLDRAFPEFAWTRQGHGWVGRQEQAQRVVKVACHDPWGFVLPDGRIVSWISYLSHGQWPNPEALAAALDRLAERAGLPAERFARYLDRSDRNVIAKRARQRELLEAFAALTGWLLRQGVGGDARAYLNRIHGIESAGLAGLPLGLYTNQKQICDSLTKQGFSEDELTDARVMRDDRLSGRIVIPWRDRFGRVQTVVAQEIHLHARGKVRTLYWKQGLTREPFGVDVAARQSFRPDRHWVVVEGLLDALYLRQQGLDGVVSFGNAGKVPTAQQWEMLTEFDAEHVTLAFASDPAGRQRTIAALDHALAADCCPQVFVTPPAAWGSCKTPATLTRLQGLGHVRSILGRRWHAYHFLADDVIARHRPEAEWTDAGLVDAVNEAIDRDAKLFRPDRAMELGRFYWPTILKETGAEWNVLRDLLRRRAYEKRSLRPDMKLKGPFHKLVYEMRAALQDHDTERCEELIRAAARKLGVDVDQLRHEVEAGHRPANSHPEMNGRGVTINEEPPIDFPQASRQSHRPRPAQNWLHVAPDETTTYQVAPPSSELSAVYAVPATKVRRKPQPVVEHARGIDIEWLNRVLAASAVAPEPPPVVVEHKPIDLNQAAYFIWKEKGCPPGQEQQCWYEAERLFKTA